MHYLVNYLCDLPPGKQLLLKVFFTWAFWNCISHLYKCVFDALTFHVQKLTQGTISKRKVKFLSKKSILTKLYNFLGKSKLSTTKKCKTTTFSRVFHPNFFRQFFSWNQSCQQLKSPKPQHFHEFFPPKKSTIFSGNQS